MSLPASNFSDQLEYFDPDRFTKPIHIIGMGSIGSAVALLVAKLGIKTQLHLWDDDIIDEGRNLPVELLYRRRDLAEQRFKVDAAAEILGELCEPDLEIVPHRARVTEDTILEGVVISGVDSMKSRSAIWEAVQTARVPIYIDGRIGGERLTLLTLNPSLPEPADRYEDEHLFPDEEGSDGVCGARNWIGVPVKLAVYVVVQLTRFARGLPMELCVDEMLDTTKS